MRKFRGFTLLEMMLVMLLIGIVLAAIGLTAAHPDREAQRQADVLVLVAKIARERAVLEHREYGLRFTTHSFEVVRFEGTRWERVDGRYDLPAEFQLKVNQAGVAVSLNDDLRRPQVLAMSSDEFTPFDVTFQRGGAVIARVVSDGLSEPVQHAP